MRALRLYQCDKEKGVPLEKTYKTVHDNLFPGYLYTVKEHWNPNLRQRQRLSRTSHGDNPLALIMQKAIMEFLEICLF